MAMKLPSKDPNPLDNGVYKTDFLNLKPSFLINTSNKYILKTWEEAFAIHGDASLEDLNPAYIASIIFNKYSASVSPYLRIKRIPRNSILTIDNNDIRYIKNEKNFKIVNPYPRICEEELYSKLRNKFLKILKKNIRGKIGCEHSSGHDSNAILGSLIFGLNLKNDNIFTWTVPQGENTFLIDEFRKFYNLLSDNCLTSDTFEYNYHYKDLLKIYGAPPQIGGNIKAINAFKIAGCKTIFSGLGGDQTLSNIGYNVGIDLATNGNFNDLANWAGSKKGAIKILLKKNLSYSLFRKFKLLQNFLAQPGRRQNYHIKKFLTSAGFEYLKGYIPNDNIEDNFNKLKTRESIIKSLNSDWLSVRAEDEIRIANFYGMGKCFPMLEESIINLLLKIDNPKLFAKDSNNGRDLLRNVFKPYLHEFLVNYPKKQIGISKVENRKNFYKIMLKETQISTKTWHPLIRKWFKIGHLNNCISLSLDEDMSFSYLQNICWVINKLEHINCWLIELENR